MANSCAPPPAAVLRALAISAILSVLLMNNHAAGDDCPSFSCGDLQDIHYPFRLRGDPPGCGVPEYELVCSDGQATIHINTGKYFVTNISYIEKTFWVVDANLDNSSCPVPDGNRHPYIYGLYSRNTHLLYTYTGTWATFISCSRLITNNSKYKPVVCRSKNGSFVYVSTTWRSYSVGDLEPSCGYLAMIPLGSWRTINYPYNTSYDYEDVVKFMRKGFTVRFPEYDSRKTNSWIIKQSLNDSINHFHEQMSYSSLTHKISTIAAIDIYFLICLNDYSYRTSLFWSAVAVVSAISIVKFIIVLAILSRLVIAPLSVLTFLAHKYWRSKISIDAVEKFLQMQLALGPTRYAYTDLTAITRHFREKLGQGGYGSVYKGVLPGEVYIAVKMLANSMCNGDDFISEVSTIGSIHHVNVVRLVGFCSEETRRGLVYEFMPHGSLDRYIFSPERRFSWEKLSEIAVGIARGINYLHRGCDMQILHFDIKPHNILLDADFTPKIADFGLAKLYPRDSSLLPVSTARGTVGYIAPEMISRSFGPISSKSDVYSFGMLLLEMAGGRKNADPDPQGARSRAYYPAWVYGQLTRPEVGAKISEAADLHEVERKLCIVGLWCIQMRPADRPTMSEVVEMLDAGIEGLEIPPEPFFCGDDNGAVADSWEISEMSTISEESTSLS